MCFCLNPLVIAPSREAEVGFSVNIIEENAAHTRQLSQRIFYIGFGYTFPPWENEPFQNLRVSAPAAEVVNISNQIRP